jgi:lipoate-protein ligase B
MKKRACEIIDLGLCPYEEAYALQKETVRSKAGGSTGDTLILVEHPPIITTGRRGGSEHICASPDTLRSAGIEAIEVDRGGDVTYHGPGQIVGYPIVDLSHHKKDVHWMLRQIEAVLIAVLGRSGIEAHARPGLTGVWTDEGKIGAIGIGVSKWISFHGFSLNVSPMMEHFDLIIPCGLKGKSVTCMRELIGTEPDMEKIKRDIVECFCDIFHLAAPLA